MSYGAAASTVAGGVRKTTIVTTALLFTAWLIDYIDRLVITLALPAIGSEFHLDNTAKGLIIGVFFLAYAFMQVPGGLLADRVGAKRAMVWAMVIWSLFTAVTGLVTGFIMLLIVRFVFGAAEGIFPAASMKAITERTTPENRMTANGVMMSSNALGAAIAPLLAAPMIMAVGWRHAFFYVAGAGVIIAVLVWRWLPPKLPEETRQADGQIASQQQALTSWQLIRVGVMWRFALMLFAFNIISWGLISWVPDYLITQQGASLGKAGIFTAMPMFAGALAIVLGGLLFDRFFSQRHRWLIVPTSLVAAVFLYFMSQTTDMVSFMLLETGGVFFMNLNFMPIFGLPLRVLPKEIAGSGAALINFGGQSAGLVAPLVMGFVADQLSFAAAFSVLVLAALLVAGTALWAPQTSAQLQAIMASSRWLRVRADR